MESIDHYKTILMNRLSELDERLHQIEADLDTQKSKDWEDGAIEREDDEVLERMGNDGTAEVLRIQAALQRMRDGTYGTCAKCGDPVGAERLNAVPDAPLCRNCAG